MKATSRCRNRGITCTLVQHRASDRKFAVVLASQGSRGPVRHGSATGISGHDSFFEGGTLSIPQIRTTGCSSTRPRASSSWIPPTRKPRVAEGRVRQALQGARQICHHSHAHNDHASGGEFFADTATFVAHENMAKNLVPPADGAPLLRESFSGIKIATAASTVGTQRAWRKALPNWISTARAADRREIWTIRSAMATGKPARHRVPRLRVDHLVGKTVELIYTGPHTQTT